MDAGVRHWRGFVGEIEAYNERVATRREEAGGRFLAGLDLGQASDFSAFSILQQIGWEADRVYHVRHLKRWPLRTPYTKIAEEVAETVNAEELRSGFSNGLAVDMNGPGAPFVDTLNGYELAVRVRPVFSHGGDKVVHDGGVIRVPKRELVSTAQILLEAGRLKIAPALPDARTLTREMETYQYKIDPLTAHDSYGAWRTGQHDDLLFSVMLPLWVGENCPPPDTSEDGYSFGTRDWGYGNRWVEY